jgi:hypothetical protein
MLAIFLDVQNEILEMTREIEVMQRKIHRFDSAENIEDKDSHIRAISRVYPRRLQRFYVS